MRTVELFAGTGSFSRVAESRNHSIFRIEMDEHFDAEWHTDITDVDYMDFPGPQIMWASPPCTTFSVGSIGTHWDKATKSPKTEAAIKGLEILKHTISLIHDLIKEDKDAIWFIENPRGMMRKVIDRIFKEHDVKDYRRVTVWYCQYGDTRAKPTDIWTNLKGWEGRQCFNGNKNCHHQSAPRGSKTGTQGLKNAKEKGRIPPGLFHELFDIIEGKKPRNQMKIGEFIDN